MEEGGTSSLFSSEAQNRTCVNVIQEAGVQCLNVQMFKNKKSIVFKIIWGIS